MNELIYQESPITDRYKLKLEMDREKNLNLYESIIQLVLEHRKHSMLQVTKKTRKWEFAYTRFLIFYCVRKETRPQITFKVMANRFGLDHTSAVNGVQVIKDMMETDDKTINDVAILIAKIDRVKRTLRIQR